MNEAMFWREMCQEMEKIALKLEAIDQKLQSIELIVVNDNGDPVGSGTDDSE